jgi:hypothetical protein
MQMKFSVEGLSRSEIESRLAAVEGVTVVDVVEPGGSPLRPGQRMDPFTYFIIVFAAHLAASLTHDAAKALIKGAFPDKNLQAVAAPNENYKARSGTTPNADPKG